MERIMPENFGGGWANQTIINPLGLTIFIVCCFLILFVKRKNIILPFVLISSFISSAQKITVLSLDFNFLRLLILVTIIRIIINHEGVSFKKHPMDKFIIAFVLTKIIIHSISSGFSETVYELGSGFDVLGFYFIFRICIQSWEDIKQIILIFLIISIPVSIFFLHEHNSGRNLFSMFGGVPEFTKIRDGRLRCQGAFPHPIIAGCYWAVIFQFILTRWWDNNVSKVLTIIGLLCILIIITATASSTPVFSVGIGFIAWLLFFLRFRMKELRWSTFLLLLSLHLVMNAPVWHLISRVTAVGGSTSHHRYQMINGAVEHFSEWWLLGTQYTGHWFLGAQDVTNQFVLEAVKGGLLTLVIFITIIVLAFRSIGNTWRREHNKVNVMLAWGLGASLMVHCANFIGVSYFGQITFLWLLTLSMIASMDNISSSNHNKKN